MSSLNYVAILGRQPELGLVELESVLGSVAVQPFGNHAALLDQLIKVDNFGGVVRVAEVIYRGATVDAKELPVALETLPLADGKTPFAVSLFGLQATRRYAEVVGLRLKKRLRSRGVSVRLVQPQTGLVVSAASLRHNQVLEKGFELIVIVAGQRMVVARTLEIQDIDAYAARDYGRPVRSAKVGMLPPKLAQTLVNTTRSSLIADPFCGTGVVLQEARLLGRTVWGADLAADMVAAAQTNLDWLSQRQSDLPQWQVEERDAQTVRLPLGCAVVSEGYLGPNMSAAPSRAQLAEVRRELLELYRQSLANWSRQLPAGTEVSICTPAWRVAGHLEYLGIVDELPQLGYTLKSFAHAATPLLYARSDQVVGRQLLLLRKN